MSRQALTLVARTRPRKPHGRARTSTWHRYVPPFSVHIVRVDHRIDTFDVLVLPQEATGINVEKGFKFGKIVTDPEDECFGATDVFSFGLMLYTMFTRSEMWFTDEGRPPLPTMPGDDGNPVKNMKQVAIWYFNGERPVFDDLQASDRLFDSFPPLLRLLIERCWASEQSDRLHFEEIESLLSDASLGWLTPSPPRSCADPITYDKFLADLDLMDNRETLADCGLDEGLELQQLREMDEDELKEDILEDDDLGLDEDTKAAFREAVAALGDDVASPTDADADGDDGMDKARAIFKETLGGGGDESSEVVTLRQDLVEKDGQLAQKDGQLAVNVKEMVKKDEVIAEKDEQLAQKDGELEQLRAQLERLEGVPPQ